jgi:hypothetical protein
MVARFHVELGGLVINNTNADKVGEAIKGGQDDLDKILTIDDSKIFTAPWSEDFLMRAHPEWAKDGLFEFVCQENNRCPAGKCGDGK